jgi:hypothetical protein
MAAMDGGSSGSHTKAKFCPSTLCAEAGIGESEMETIFSTREDDPCLPSPRCLAPSGNSPKAEAAFPHALKTRSSQSGDT